MILEYAAFFFAYRYYVYLRIQKQDSISDQNRLSIILGAAVGALIGSRVAGFLENPILTSQPMWFVLMNVKTIMGGLFGGLLGVEFVKKIIGEKSSSGDLFTLPIVVGIFIGRVGCFLSGVNEFTYGQASDFILAMDLGDGVMRHPLALYELFFLLFLFVVLRQVGNIKTAQSGNVFKLFMVLYFSFRFFIEFLKPNEFFILGLSTIQWLCLICLIYYHKFLIRNLRYAYKKIHLL